MANIEDRWPETRGKLTRTKNVRFVSEKEYYRFNERNMQLVRDGKEMLEREQHIDTGNLEIEEKVFRKI